MTIQQAMRVALIVSIVTVAGWAKARMEASKDEEKDEPA